jgi:Glycosyl hydrolases family 2, TIM barrel domain
LFACSIAAVAQSSSESAPEIGVANRQFTVGGREFLVKGIHYGPWRPGTGPNKGYPYPSLDDVAQDFQLIAQTHANTVLVYDAPGEVIDLADAHGLKVVYVFALDWWSVGGPTQETIRAQVVERVRALREKRALLAWMLGNEIGADVLQMRGDALLVAGLQDLYRAVKEADRSHPISHANWPQARHLDLKFLDFVSFNVYPLWPPEVVAMGYGPYIERVLRPIAAGRPLLISEFGANTVEAGEEGQSRLLRESWDGLVRAGAAGGIVFEFADEWWKNYNNPVRPGDWWTRQAAPNDEQQHDNDPEEAYGLVTAERVAKPSLAVVAQMFGGSSGRQTARLIGLTGLLVLVLAALAGWIWARRRHARPAA